MEKFRKKLKSRIVFETVLVIMLLPIAAYTLYSYYIMDAPVNGSPVSDFIGGFINGLRGALVLCFVIYLVSIIIRDLKAIQHENILRDLLINENDERTAQVNKAASNMSFYIIYYIILVAALILGLYNLVVGLTLICVWVFIVITRVLTFILYNRRM